MTIHIRSAEPRDASRLRQMIQALAEYEREPDAVEVSETQLAEQLGSETPPFHCIFAENAQGTTLGFALYFLSYSTWRGRPGIYLEDLFVIPDARKSGVGRALIEALLEECRHRGCARLEWSVLNWNTPAIDFYRALGAHPLNEWTTWRLNV